MVIRQRSLAFGAALASVLTIAGLIGGNVARAAQTITDAKVSVVNAPIVTQTADLEFGQVLRPTIGTNNIEVTPSGVRTLLGTGNSILLGGTVRAASYTIDAVPGTTISVAAAFFDGGGSGMTLGNFQGSYAGGPSTGINPGDAATFPANASATLTVGGDLIGLTTTTQPQDFTLTFTLDVNYQ